MPRGRGRPPTKIDDAFIESLRRALRGRNTIEASAAMNGVPRSSLYRWTRRGRQLQEAIAAGEPTGRLSAHDRTCLELWDMVTRALAEAEVQTVALIGAAGTSPSIETRTTRKMIGQDERGQPIYAEEVTTISRPPDWRALMALAERRWENWSPRQRAVVSGPEGGPIPVEIQVDKLLTRWGALRAEAAEDDVPALGPAPPDEG